MHCLSQSSETAGMGREKMKLSYRLTSEALTMMTFISLPSWILARLVMNSPLFSVIIFFISSISSDENPKIPIVRPLKIGILKFSVGKKDLLLNDSTSQSELTTGISKRQAI